MSTALIIQPAREQGQRQPLVASSMDTFFASSSRVSRYLPCFRLAALLTIADSVPSATHVSSAKVRQSILELSDRDLALELQRYAVEEYRTFSEKPDPILTFQQIHCKSKLNRIVYDYQFKVLVGRC